MPTANKNYFNFSGGFNSDVSPLNFPESTSVDEVNFPLRIDGERHRRKGMDYEDSYVSASQTLVSTDAVESFDWHNVTNSSDLNFQVVQTGSTLHFYDKSASSLSNNKKSFTVDLLLRGVDNITVTDALIASTPIQGTYGNGVFVVVGRYIEPFYIKYNLSGDTITENSIFLRERDFIGTRETIGVTERPTVLSNEHKYDLYNQGWTAARVATFLASTIAAYPSNADRWETGVYTDPTTGLETFDPTQIDVYNLGNHRAAQGHLITPTIFNRSIGEDGSRSFEIDTYTFASPTITMTTVDNHNLTSGDLIFTEGNSFSYRIGADCSSPTYHTFDNQPYSVTVTGAKTFTFTIGTMPSWAAWCTQYISKGIGRGVATSNPNDPTLALARPQATTFFAGRVWYGGIQDPEYGGDVYFSQIVSGSNDAIGDCYQVADPTSEISDLLPTDGGVIRIPEMGQLLKMNSVGESLVLFADNGVWAIEVGESGYFTADSYAIRKITNINVVASRAIVFTEGVAFFWSTEGIYIVQPEKVSGLLTASSISANRIETHLQTIPYANKVKVKGVYDAINKELKWIYHTNTSATQVYSKELVFNITLNAWTKHDIDITVGPYVLDINTMNNKGTVDTNVKYLTNVSNTHITFADYTNTSFLDWETFDTIGIDAEAYIITSYEMLDDAMRRKFANYIFCYFNRTENTATADGNGDFNLTPASGCQFRSRWDWADNSVANKWSVSRQAYRFKRYFQPTAGAYDNGYPVVVTKNKTRGSGKVASFEFTTEAGKDCQLLGWAASFTGIPKP